MPRPIDHLVLAVPDLGAAMDRYRDFGFKVGARNRHPWGTENAIVQLEGTFLELIGLGDGFAVPATDDPAAVFARPVAVAVLRGGGLALVAMGSRDADADAGTFEQAGLGRRRRLDFGRSAEAPDGSRRPVAFELAFVDDPSLTEAGLFACRHLHPENFWNEAAQRHDNGALRLDTVVLTVDAPRHHEAAFAAVCECNAVGDDRRLTVETPTGRIDLMTPSETAARFGDAASPGRFSAFSVVVQSLSAVRSLLDQKSIAHREVAGAVAVPSAAAFGVTLAFVSAACHSHR